MRVNVPFGQQPSLKIVDGTRPGAGRIGFSIQNVSAVDVYYSDDQRTLDTVPSSLLPNAGHLLSAAGSPANPPTVYPWFIGSSIFVRAQSAGAQLEVLIYNVDKPCGCDGQ